MEKAFGEFWEGERSEGLRKIARDEGIPIERIDNVMGEYLYTQKLPSEQDVIDMIPEEKQPKILQRQGVVDRIRGAIERIVDVFEW